MSTPSKIGGGSSTWVNNPMHTPAKSGSASTLATVGPTGTLPGGGAVQQLATPQAPGQRGGIGQKIAHFFTSSLPNFFKNTASAVLGLCFGRSGAGAQAAPPPAQAQPPAMAQAPATAQASATTAVAAPVVRSFAENRAALQNLLPAGITVDDQGIISGTYHPTKFATGATSVVGDLAGRTIVDAANDAGARALTPKPGKSLPTIAGIPSVSQASSDFYRLNLTVQNGANTFSSRGDPVKDEQIRNENVMNAVKDLTDDDNTCTVLSAVLNQQFSRYLLESMETSGGDYAQFQPLSISAGQTKVRADDGSITSEVPKGIGGAPMTLSKLPNGDYKFEVTWDNLFKESGRGGTKTELPGMGDTAVRALSTLEFVIDGDAAQQGRLSISTPNPPSIIFSGRMTPGN